MQDFSPAFPSLCTDDIVEFLNVPYSDWPCMLKDHSCYRIKRDNADEIGYEIIYKVRDGIIMRFIDIKLLRENRVKVRSLGGYVNLFFIMDGNHYILKDSNKEYTQPKGTCSVSYDHEDTLIEDFGTAETHLISLEIFFEKNLLKNEFFEEDSSTIPVVLQQALTKNKESIYHTVAMDTEIYQALSVLFASSYEGKVRRRFFEAKSIEMFCLMLRLLKRQEQAISKKPLAKHSIKLLQKAGELLVADLSSPPSVDELSSQLGISKSALQDRFKQFYGLSLRDFLIKKRMETAKILLSQNDSNINQIAWQLGYEHPCNFVTAFKRQFGLTPKAYSKLEVKR
ncbi:AraC family transcriptional regulator [Dasania marina]|uniref:helix-turn-helix domain-containing protein n=1 Tax=Dasania marina TaxID=471499 RepID=UPI0030DD173E|tara:strand:+ start:27207 stop:28226 length:1020 start_codon:yes stop_codon:yes gene_type:complete